MKYLLIMMAVLMATPALAADRESHKQWIKENREQQWRYEQERQQRRAEEQRMWDRYNAEQDRRDFGARQKSPNLAGGREYTPADLL